MGWCRVCTAAGLPRLPHPSVPAHEKAAFIHPASLHTGHSTLRLRDDLKDSRTDDHEQKEGQDHRSHLESAGVFGAVAHRNIAALGDVPVERVASESGLSVSGHFCSERVGRTGKVR